MQIFDRSPVCTLALSTYFGNPVSAALSEEIDKITRERVYDRRVFFIRDIGFIEPADTRRITYEDSLEFEGVHAEAYQTLGYELVDVPRSEVADRTNVIEAFVASWN